MLPILAPPGDRDELQSLTQDLWDTAVLKGCQVIVKLVVHGPYFEQQVEGGAHVEFCSRDTPPHAKNLLFASSSFAHLALVSL